MTTTIAALAPDTSDDYAWMDADDAAQMRAIQQAASVSRLQSGLDAMNALEAQLAHAGYDRLVLHEETATTWRAPAEVLPEPDYLMTTREAIDHYKLPSHQQRAMGRAARSGQLLGRQSGDTWLFYRSEVERWLRDKRRGRPPKDG